MYSFWDKKAKRFIVLTLFVDDGFVCCRNKEEAMMVLCLFYSHGMKLTGVIRPKIHLGYGLTYYRSKLNGSMHMTIDVDQYFAKLFSKYQDRINQRKRARTLPHDPTMSDKTFELAFIKDETEYRKSQVTEARAVTGELMYACGKTAIDIVSPTNRLARTQVRPSPLWWELVDAILQYLATDAKRKPALMYYAARKDASLFPMICGSSDASWRLTLNNRSMIGVLVCLGWGDRWSVVKHSGSLCKSVSLSTADSESYGLCKQFSSLLSIANPLKQEGIDSTPWPSGDNSASLITAVTGNRKAMAYQSVYMESNYDSIKRGLVHKPMHNVTNGNWTDPLSKCMKSASDKRHKTDALLISRNSPEFLAEFEELPESECNIEITMKEIHDACKSYGFKLSQQIEDELIAAQREAERIKETLEKYEHK